MAHGGDPSRESAQPGIRGVRLTPARIALLYLLISNGWILTSDWVVESLLGDVVNTSAAQTIKGLAFVSLVGVLLYVLMTRAERDRARTDALLRASEERNRKIVDSALEGIWLMDARWRTTFVNDQMCEMLGYTPAEMLGRPLSDFMEPEDVERSRACKERREQGHSDRFDMRLRRKDGSHLWTIVSSNPVMGRDGTFEGVLGMVTDITERKRVEDALQSLASGSSRPRGRDALRDLVETIAETLGVRCVLVAEPALGREGFVRTLALWDKGEQQDEIEYELRGTPCKDVFEGKEGVVPSGVCALFPDDALLRELHLQSYAGAPLYDAGGEVIGILVVLDDKPIASPDIVRSMLRVFASRASSELLRSRAEAGREQSEERYMTLVETSPDGVFIQCEGRFAFMNGTMAKMLGATAPEELVGRRVLDHVHPEDRAVVAERIRRLNETSAAAPAIEERFLRLDGSAIDVEVAATPYTHEGRPGAQVIVRDIALRKQAERELREREEQYRAVFEAAADALEIFDLEGNLVDANPEASRMHGYTHEEFMKLSAPDFIDERSLSEFEDFKREAAAGRVFTTRALNKRRDGTPFPIDVRGTRMSYAGQPHLLAVVRDVTEQVRSERRQALMMQELDHRVKNNLAAVLSLAEQSLASAGSIEEFRRSFIGRVRALATTHAALARTKWEGVELLSVVRETLGAYNADGTTRVEMQGESVSLPPRAALPVCLALHELATNAIKYGALSVPDGRVRVSWMKERTTSGHDALRINWEESGGPEVLTPPKRGLGTDLIEGMIGYELGGRVWLTHPRNGVQCSLLVPLAEDVRLTESEPGDSAHRVDGATSRQETQA